MTRLILGATIGLLVGMGLGAALGIHAQQLPTDETVAVAAEAGVDALELQGASNSTGLAPRDYLIAAGELVVQPPTPPAPAACSWPICGSLGQRIFCVEAIESHHGAAMWNPVPWYGEHASGWLGWLPSTARSVGVTIGNRTSEWAGAARMLALGRGREFYGIAAGIC